jgi:nucleotide-binding universal stress UspA family protein
MYKHMLISTGGSEVAQKGVDHGLSLAKSAGAKVTIVAVTEHFPTFRACAFTLWVHRSWRHKR